MFIHGTFAARNVDGIAPRECRPFSFHSNVCIGDLIAILACSVAGIGFICWAVHAIRKMRMFPFNIRSGDKSKRQLNGENETMDPYHAPSAFDNSLLVRRGVVQPPNLPARARTRLTFSEPEEDFYRPSARTSSDSYSAHDSMTTPLAPRLPPAGVQSLSRARHSGHHASLTRDGAYGDKYGYGMKDDSIRNVSPSRARGSPLHSLDSGYGSYPSLGMNRDLMTHAL